MKVLNGVLVGRALTRASLVAAVLAASIVFAPAPAEAITRKRIMARSKTWVAKRVPYSQARYHRGYRQDCSGFVSMAWKLKRSYTTRTIHARTKRVKIRNLRVGDAVWKPGHISIFGGWKNKKKRQYYALEQTTWGSHAKKRVRTIPRNAKGLRYKGIEAPRKVATKKRATSPVTTAAAKTPVTTAVTTAVTTESVSPEIIP